MLFQRYLSSPISEVSSSKSEGLQSKSKGLQSSSSCIVSGVTYSSSIIIISIPSSTSYSSSMVLTSSRSLVLFAWPAGSGYTEISGSSGPGSGGSGVIHQG